VYLDRRSLLRAGVSLAGLGLLAGCQMVPPLGQASARLRRIGFLTSDALQGPELEALRQELRDLGYVEGQTIAVDSRISPDDVSLPRLAQELLQLPVDVIVTGTGPSSLAAKKATDTIPIVIANTDDPVGSGLVASLGHPGGNVTGLASYSGALLPKRLELLKEIVPGLARVGVLWSAAAPSHVNSMREAETASRALGVEAISLELRDAEMETAFEQAAQQQVQALMTTPGPIFGRERFRLSDLALQYRQPMLGNFKTIVAAGSLISYGPDYTDLFRRSATYVDKIFKGRSPADLPVEQPTRFELAINLKTAESLALSVPQTILAQATDVLA
jgi:putative tryptophan/tyrosine transport system substrate-binding protein